MNERLGEIKEKLVRWQTEEIESTNVDLWPKDIRDVEWLIEQAERVDMLVHENMEIRKGYQERSKRVQELEREIEGREKFELGTTDNLKILREQNKRYREALEQIKKEETVTTALPEGQKAYTASGHIARKALESESE